MFEAISSITLLAQDAPAVDQSVPFWESSQFFFLLLIVAVVAGFFLARMITKSLAISEYGGRTAIVFVSVLVAALIIVSQWPPKFGVDLRGGINMIGSLNLAELDNTGEAPKAADVIPALMARVNPSGTKEIMIRPLGLDKIEVTMPTVDLQEAKDIWARLVSTGALEFRIVANQVNHGALFRLAEAQALLPKTSERMEKRIVDAEGVVQGKWVRFARVYDSTKRERQPNAAFKYFPNPRSNLVRNGNDGRIVNLRQVPLGKDPDNNGADLSKWAKEQGYRSLELLVVEPDERQDVTGGYLSGIQRQADDKGRNSVAFNLNAEGSIKMGMLTSNNIDKPMGIVLDGEIHSAPNIQSRINSRGTITGDFSRQEIEDLIISLKSGKLSVALNKEPISTDFIESTLGNELKQKGIFAIGFSLMLVLVFMVFYYRFAGIVASIALLLNLVLILALVMSIQYPFTLTGLAGLVLTVGMSVDANVLIFERIREETDRGAALRMAIRNGFDKATVTIVDANLTTLITAFVLYALGTEQIKGFAVTLILGIVISMFTAIFVSRLIFDIWERKRWLKALNMTRILQKTTIPFLEKVSVTGIISAVLIVGGLAATFILGSRILDQDLRGGSTARMVFSESKEIDWVREKLEAAGEGLTYEATGEPIEFTVSSFGSGDEGMDGRKYKVDSNLPAWEGVDSGVKKFKELDEILEEVFAGELMLHHVDFTGLDVSAVDQAPAPGRISRTASGSRFSWNGVPNISVASLTGGILTYQEPPAEATPAAAAPATQDPANETTPPVETQESDTTDAPVAPAQPGGLQVGEIQESGVGGVDTTDPIQTPIGDVAVSRKMTIVPEILGKTLKALILEESERLGLSLTEDNVKVTTPDVLEGEASGATVSKDWTVEVNVSEKADADELFKVWAARFNEMPYFQASSSVGSQIAEKTTRDAMTAIIVSLLGIIGYCWFRFQNLAFGLAAVIALIHDVLIVVGAIAFSHWLASFLGFAGIIEFKISLEVIAALLTVIGYSLNDTIVVFDRIREVRGKRTEITADMINISISQTLSRTILTSVTTFIVVFILYMFGGDAIHGFAYALVIGVLVGTYSSIFVASPALLWLMNTVGLNPGEIDPEVAKA